LELAILTFVAFISLHALRWLETPLESVVMISNDVVVESDSSPYFSGLGLEMQLCITQWELAVPY